MTSTISEPPVSYEARDGRRQLRGAEPRGAEPRGAEPRGAEPQHEGPGGRQAELSVKTTVPQPGIPLLRRPRVTELPARAAAHPGTLACGPRGAGKNLACAPAAATASPARRP